MKITAALLADRKSASARQRRRADARHACPPAVPRAAMAAYAQVVRRVLAALDAVALEALGARRRACRCRRGGADPLPRPCAGASCGG